MRVSIVITTLLFSLLHGTVLCLKPNDEINVTYIMDKSEFYNFTNTPDAYTIVKFYTTWCSHCKTLKPIFEELASSFSHENKAGGKPQVNFIEVNCEVFGNSLCSSLPGFPIIHVIKPKVGSDAQIDVADDEVAAETVQPESLWKRVLQKMWKPKANKDSFVEPGRIVEFAGKRDGPTIRRFIETIVAKTLEEETISIVLDPSSDCASENDLCMLGKSYISELETSGALSHTDNKYETDVSTLSKERTKLQNMQRNLDLGSEDEEMKQKVKNIRFLSQVLNHLEDATVCHTKDEL